MVVVRDRRLWGRGWFLAFRIVLKSSQLPSLAFVGFTWYCIVTTVCCAIVDMGILGYMWLWLVV